MKEGLVISKVRRAFFALGSLGAFQGDLNPLPARNIFETCVLPILLYGCETWLLDSSSISKLEKFQSKIGRRILRLPKNHSGKVVRLGLHWPSMSTRVLIRKLTFLAKLLAMPDDTISKRIFTSLAIVDVYNSSIVQQCRMLESDLGTHFLAQCLVHPQEASSIVKSCKASILKQDFNLLLSSSSTHATASLVASVAQTTSWCRLWDVALDQWVQGTRGLQSLLKELSPRIYDYECKSCGMVLNKNKLWLEHLTDYFPDRVHELSIFANYLHIDVNIIFSVANSGLRNT